MPGEQSWPTQPYPTNPPPYMQAHVRAWTTSARTCRPMKQAAFTKRLLAATNKGIFTPISLKDTVHVPTSNGGTLFGGTAAEPAHRRRLRRRARQPGHSAAAAARAKAAARRAAADAAGAGRLPAELPGVSRRRPRRGPKRPGARPGDGGSGQQHRRGRAAVRRGDAIRAVIATGKGRMPAFPHLDRRPTSTTSSAS